MSPKFVPSEPIALVGSACHFAGDVNSPSKLWELLREPRDVRNEIPDTRFSAKGFYHPNNAHHGHSNVMHSYLINDDPSTFDAEFFGINSVETKAMDPQQRVLMETVYEAIESAGMTLKGLQGSDTSVYAGVMCGDYEAMQLRDLDAAPTYFAVGTSRAILSNRISYFFNWHGASITMDTACSSSLVAIHMAVQALRAGESRMAVACGSNLILGPESYIIESKVKMLSPDGLGRMWDRDANGYARGDGVAAVVLKTLSAALADGDHIECLIRETGVNQDGATAGLTMPSATAQRALIHSTYAKAGLDLTAQADRPQYFEAHGTGTPAGDPIEAEAISSAFFGDEKGTKLDADGHPLYVGSIKTVLGHTEGTAGVAAILKASLAIQNSCIPPNLLFDNLSPSVAPFYNNLEIRRVATSWPHLPNTQPKRASVNSFGFGGTNAHAILESYEKPTHLCVVTSAHSIPLFTPFVFSAVSETSLRANISAYATYLEGHPEISVRDLAYTLRERRSVFPYRVSFPVTSLDDLKSKILARLEDKDTSVGVKILGRSGAPSKILGVFTGQGAQYARMGADLIERSSFAQRVIQELEVNLAQLPSQDRPSWSLRTEILADASVSRINEAALSQPLCTAVQIMLVDLLRAANVHFGAVVGHSSGEIAAAYAAGFLTARDAIYIAYYRGLHCKQAASPNGKLKGAMLAAGISMEDAMQLCEMEEFAGRINVAASNSSTSVTISGDEDAIEELQVILDDEKKFNRRLKVDQAYHSKHMLPCFKPYVESMRRAGVQVLRPSLSQCTWYSSVYDGQPVESELRLSDVYWGQNMTKPVAFSQALNAAVSAGGAFDVVLEVGCHPALKGPASQTIQEVLQKPIPYHGTLYRGNDSIEAFSMCLGFLWSYLDKASVNLNSCELAISEGQQQFNVVKGLPTYQWNHEVKHWHESRRSRRMRLRQKPFHPLLGDVSPDSAPHHLRWKNMLKPSEIEWLEGHQVQNQIVFPAAGYVSTALEAAQVLAEGKGIRLIEVSDFFIHQAVMFDRDDTGVEVLIELSQIFQTQPDLIVAKFTYSAALGGQAADLSLAADGELKIFLGDASINLLPERGPTPSHLINVEQSRLYNFMESLEYNFTGPFRSLSTLRRKLGKASCLATRASTNDAELLLVHPVDLDAAFQSVMLAYSYPDDDQLRNLHLPTSIAKVRVNPAVFVSQKIQDDYVTVDSTCNRIDRASPGSGFSGNVDLYSNGCSNAAIQVDQVRFKPLGTTANSDRNVFYKMHWVPSAPDGMTAADGIPVTQDDTDLLWVLSRIASYYQRKFDEDVPEDSPARFESPLCHYLNYARHMTFLLRSGEHKYAKMEWMNDSLDDVMNEVKAKRVTDNSDVKIMLLVGEIMPRVFKGETTMLEHFRSSGLLDEYYAHGFGTMQSSLWLSQAVKQITDRHPHLSLLEIGAGTGGATKNILRTIGHSFDSYTFTDISSSFFENAAERFSPWRDRMVFKVCDAEKDPLAQGFTEGAYHVVVASLVVHATAELDKTMRNLRRLLKPGGFLIIGEGSSDGPLQSGDGFIFGALTGWWLGVEEGRKLSPFVNVPQWDAILKRTGFSGIDTISPPKFLDTLGVILFVSQAVDDRINFIREPLSFPASTNIKRLVIVGGRKKPVAYAVHELENIFKELAGQIIVYKTLEDVDYSVVDAESTVISLSELDQPVFKDITPERWYGFRKMFEIERTVLWLTSGRLEDEPFSNMIVGFGRSVVHELEDLRLQFLDVPDPSKIDSRTIAESLVRFHAKDIEGEDILYTAEPEIVIDAEGHQTVPRLQPISAANDRYNSIQRPITHEVDVNKSVVELQQNGNGCTIRQLSRYETSKGITGLKTIEMRITHSILSALKTPVGHKFLALGVDSRGTLYLALVPSLTSVIKVPEKSAVSCDLLGFSEDAFLTLAAAHLVSMAIVDPLITGQKLVVHNASDVIAQAISAQTSSNDIGVIYTADSTDKRSPPSSWIKLPPYLGRSDLGQMIRADIACFVGLSNESSENELSMLSNLSPHCRKETSKTIYSHDGIDTGSSSASILSQTLGRAVGYIRKFGGQECHHNAETVSLESLAAGERPEDPMRIIDWTASTSLPVRVTRLDIKPLFKGDKTYWLCGMSGTLGISLCDWMIDRGVKNLVLTSRNPKVEPAWIDNHKRNEVNVRILSCDVTNEKALRVVHQKIVETFPPIVGVLNGAMVLRDVSVRNMMIDQVTDVIRPKVLGSIHLDQIFHDVDLDFFVLLSSINCVIGNVGQANYAAANMGMCGVAANRRKRGLASVAVNVGAVMGAGYITQSDRQLDVTAAKMAMMHLSEEDFHQIFAEAMEAGYLDSPVGPEISTGLLDISPDSANIPKWYSNPKFARFIVHQTAGNDGQKEQSNAASIQDCLQACRTEQDVLQLIKQAFAAQLRKILQTSTADDEILFMRGIDLGLDSLISVDIRAWFLKNFQVSIPILKIMGNDVQMASLAELAAEDIPAELVPLIGGEGRNPSAGDETATSNISATSSRLDTPTNLSSGTRATTPKRSTSLDGDALGDKIDWDTESCPPEGIAQMVSSVPPNTKPSIILLTGVSGLLGHHLLNSLLEQPSIRKIICVAVRQLTERLETKQLPPRSDRVVYYEGDLRLPHFGLSDEDVTVIFAEVDAVIHNGSDTSHLKYYSVVREANVVSTHQLVRLCLPRMVPLHYVSSAGVALFAGKDAFPEISATASGKLPPPDGAHGYMCGKWASERLLERANAMYGLKVWMQRPSTIIREGDDATTAKAEFDWVNALLHYAHRIQAVPKVLHNSGAFDLVHVQSVCDDIIRELLDNRPKLAHGVTYVNNVGDIVIPMDRLAELGKQKGKKGLYKVLPMEEWAQEAVAAGLHPAVAALIETFDEPGSAPYPALLKAKGVK